MPLPQPARRVLFALTLAVAVAGCVAQSSTHYPSLLPRAIETRGDAEPEVAPVAVAPDPVVDATLAELRATLDETIAAFTPAAAMADKLATAANGDPAGGERWIAAQTALGGLDGYRATTSSIVSDLDRMALDRAADGKPDYPAIATLQATAQAALDAQAARIAAIGERLPGA